MPTRWIDTHCHLDAAEFDGDRDAVVGRARTAGVSMQVLPAVEPANFDAVAGLAARHGLAYGLGIHPLYLPRVDDDAADRLRDGLSARRDDPRLVAVGEIGIDHFVRDLDPVRQERLYLEQLKAARDAALPVLLHCRRSADALLKGLRRVEVPGGIVHAFNGSEQQARQFLAMGFALGFGGAMTFERALQLRRLAATLPDEAIVLETDAPDIPPHWLYRTAAQREAGERARNEPAELPRIAQAMAALRGVDTGTLAALTTANARRVLPRLAPLLEAP